MCVGGGGGEERCGIGGGDVSKLAYREDSYLTELQPDIKKKNYT